MSEYEAHATTLSSSQEQLSKHIFEANQSIASLGQDKQNLELQLTDLK